MDPSWDYQDHGKGHGKGKGSKNKGKGGKPADETLDKLMAKIDKLEANQKKLLQKGQTTLADAKALTGAQNTEQLICPKCGCAHNNLEKYKCRNNACRAVLRPESLPESAIVNRRPKDPLATNYYQSFFARLGALELLEEKEQAPPSADIQEDAVDMAVDSGIEEDQREAQEKILEDLKSAGASASVIKLQEGIVNSLPKPKPGKPLLDAGRLMTALSVSKEHHDRIAKADSDLVEQCEVAIRKAQDAWNQAKRTQQENIQKGEKTIKAIQVQIAKAQEISKEELKLPEAEPRRTQAQDNPDFMLLKNDFMDNINKNQQLPPHLLTFLQNVDLVPKQVNASASSSGGTTSSQVVAAEKSLDKDAQPKAPA